MEVSRANPSSGILTNTVWRIIDNSALSLAKIPGGNLYRSFNAPAFIQEVLDVEPLSNMGNYAPRLIRISRASKYSRCAQATSSLPSGAVAIVMSTLSQRAFFYQFRATIDCSPTIRAQLSTPRASFQHPHRQSLALSLP
jgi:hypothetical protein